MVIRLRSCAFTIAFFTATTAIMVVGSPCFLFPRRVVLVVAQFWARTILWLAEHIAGMKMVVEGKEYAAPSTPHIMAAKHQSAWDTIALLALIKDPAFILKRELLLLPLFGLYLWGVRNIPIDRGAGASTIKKMVKASKERVADGCNIVIFPEGTRMAPDVVDPPYLPGVAALYTQLNLPVIPIALNSGLCWGRNAFWKQSGIITVRFQPPIPQGLDRKIFMTELKDKIERPSQELMAQEIARRAAL